MYFCDTHSHSSISPDCDVPLLEMAEAAIAAGVEEFCVTDHCDLLDLDGNPAAAFLWLSAAGPVMGRTATGPLYRLLRRHTRG